MRQQKVEQPTRTIATIAERSILLDRFPLVIEPSPYTLALADQLGGLNATQALDIGCGSGLLAILLAMQGTTHVWAVDIDLAAIAATAANATLNDVAERITTIQSDVFTAIPRGTQFDLIVANPPATPAWRGIPRYNRAGSDGRLVLDTLITQAPAYLGSSGRLIFTHSSRLSWDETAILLARSGYRYQILARQDVPSRPEYYQNYPEYFADLEARGAVEIRDDGFYETVKIVLAVPSTRRGDPATVSKSADQSSSNMWGRKNYLSNTIGELVDFYCAYTSQAPSILQNRLGLGLLAFKRLLQRQAPPPAMSWDKLRRLALEYEITSQEGIMAFVALVRVGATCVHSISDASWAGDIEH